MNAYDLVGLLAGLAGLGLALLGLLLALFSSLRMLYVLRRPDKGHVARGIAVAGLVLALCGVALFFAAELSPFRRTVDRGAPWLSALSLVVAAVAGVRAGRRRAAPAQAEPEGAPRPAKDEPAEPSTTAQG